MFLNPNPNVGHTMMGPQQDPGFVAEPTDMQRRMAAALRGNPAGQGRMVGKQFVPTTGMQHLGNLAAGLGSAYLGSGGAGGMPNMFGQ